MMESTPVYNPVSNDYLNRLHHLGMREDVAYAYLERLINTQTYTMATGQILKISATLMLALITLHWWARPPFVASRDRGH